MKCKFHASYQFIDFLDAECGQASDHAYPQNPCNSIVVVYHPYLLLPSYQTGSRWHINYVAKYSTYLVCCNVISATKHEIRHASAVSKSLNLRRNSPAIRRWHFLLGSRNIRYAAVKRLKYALDLISGMFYELMFLLVKFADSIYSGSVV